MTKLSAALGITRRTMARWCRWWSTTFATLDAAFTVVTGPYRIRDTDDTKELWEMWIHDQHQARLVMDPTTPVIGFQDERTSQAFRAACEQGRVAILRMKSPSSLRFAPNR